MERHSKGEFHGLKELKLFELEFFIKQFWMTPEKLENLLVMVASRITTSSLRITQSSNWARGRLCVVIFNCLASGGSKDMIAAR